MINADIERTAAAAYDAEFGSLGGAPLPDPEKCAMDDAFIAVIAECRQAAQAIEAQARGALILFMRQRGLAGDWRIAANGRELERAGGG